MSHTKTPETPTSDTRCSGGGAGHGCRRDEGESCGDARGPTNPTSPTNVRHADRVALAPLSSASKKRIGATDDILLERARAGDLEATTDLLVRHRHMVLVLIHEVHRIPLPDAEDVLQEVHRRFIRYLPSITYARGFLQVAATGLCLNYHRDRARLQGGLRSYARESAATTPRSSAAAGEIALAQRLDLRAAIDAAGCRCGDLLKAIVLDGMSYEEYARSRGVPIGSIGPMLGRYLRRIRLHLTRRGYTGSGS